MLAHKLPEMLDIFQVQIAQPYYHHETALLKNIKSATHEIIYLHSCVQI